jgi:hypothetical protein
MPAQKEKTFWEGFGSAMTLCPHTKNRLRVYFRGHELLKCKSEDSLASDWKLVGASLGVILKKYEEEDESIRQR